MGYNGNVNYKEQTIQFYDNHTEEFASTANNVNMLRNYEHFLKYVPKGGSIVDMGCGSGRDLKYFAEAGYAASGVDASEGMCKVAHSYSGCPVVCCDALSWAPESKIDAIWANGSLLHLKVDEIVSFLKTKMDYLKPDGVIYFSMKAGISEGFDQTGRYFTPFSESIIDSVLAEGRIKVIERWTETDSLGREGFHWEAIILGKTSSVSSC